MSAAIKLTTDRQIKAASPAQSAWVGANAGSGKTRVLTNRVARLLLAGADPSRILCITYTKAAAAEMAERLFTLLGDWALADNNTLKDSLNKLEGIEGKNRSTEELSRARRLFARALETPGGLKIQTIHAFCSHVLKRFPLEAGVPPGFKELEDADANSLVELALEFTASDAQADDRLDEAFDHLGKMVGVGRTVELLKSFTMQRQKWGDITQACKDQHTLMQMLADTLGVDPTTTPAQIIHKVLNNFTPEQIRSAAESLRLGGKTANDHADKLERAAATENEADRFATLKSLFFTSTGTLRKKFADVTVNKAIPTLEHEMKTAQDMIATADDEISAITICLDTHHFLYVAQHMLTHYKKLKWTRSALDFDDLILHTKTLFSHGDHAARWVMYKLDNGLDHILVDEAQDTSPGQWDIIEQPLREFFTGIDEKPYQRTFFAVGDEKQSIYSFQGANAGLFREKSVTLGKSIAAVSAFDNIPLTLSFRSTAPVLNFVDAAFLDPSAMEGLGDVFPLTHDVARLDDAGMVALWPLVPPPEKAQFNPWDAPVDARSTDHPNKKLCDHIALTISEWLTSKSEILAAQNRPVQASDIIILVQQRSSLFKQMIKSLTAHNVPVAGADRLSLLSEIAIQDLLSYARCVLFTEDDLSLAETLKSPFFGFEDDDLFTLAHGSKIGLWTNLHQRQTENPLWARACREIGAAREIAIHQGAFDFFMHLLDHADPEQDVTSGRKRLYTRLGPATADSLDAFLRQTLDYEAHHPRSLQGFINWFEENAGEIKRELDQESNAVRIMTVHGAKGLEGNIVFLLDTHKKPNTSKLGPIYPIPPANSEAIKQDMPVLVRSAGQHTTVTQAALDEEKRLQYEEYRRLFYVAATRARDRLYICGIQTSKPDAKKKTNPSEWNDDSWYQLAEKGFERLQAKHDTIHPVSNLPWDGTGQVFCSKQHQTPEVNTATAQVVEAQKEIPDWLMQACQPEISVGLISPSTLADRLEDAAAIKDQGPTQIPVTGTSPVGHQDRFLRGRTLHRMLELLPGHAATEYAVLADRLLARLVPDITPTTRNAWRDEVITVLTHPDFADVFAEGSRAEVSIGGTPSGVREGLVINGQIDRLIVTPDQVLIVDYKTNQPPPAREEDVADAYLGQMAAYRALAREIYPGRAVKTALLWTFEAKLMMLSDKLLDHAFARFLA